MSITKKYQSRNLYSGKIKSKLIILLLGGLALSLSRSPRQQFEILSEMADEWQGIRRSSIKRAIKSIHRDRLVSEIKSSDGSIRLVLTERGKEAGVLCNLDKLKLKVPAKWDGNWRIVIFDVPEKLKVVRESLRMHLNNLGFIELQKSAFIYPFPCFEEVSEVVNFYGAEKHVRMITASAVDNEESLKIQFDL
ncbi:MAG: hypothetical protein WC250_02155 [Candidatus Paceibacterota bacterium]|jgi:phenylacetic acid degradation operon negative regulatory protein